MIEFIYYVDPGRVSAAYVDSLRMRQDTSVQVRYWADRSIPAVQIMVKESGLRTLYAMPLLNGTRTSCAQCT